MKAHPGFTLVELLVVIAVIGLLASVILVAMQSARQKSRDAKRVGDISQLSKAMELFFSDKLSYPTTTGVAMNVGGVLTSSSSACTNGTAGCVNFLTNYVKLVPASPLPADSSAVYNCGNSYGGGTAIANDYQYYGTGAGNNLTAYYTITFCLGGPTGNFTAGVHTLTQAGTQ